MTIPPFHLAFPVNDLDIARAFYGCLLGCPEGRSVGVLKVAGLALVYSKAMFDYIRVALIVVAMVSRQIRAGAQTASG